MTEAILIAHSDHRQRRVDANQVENDESAGPIRPLLLAVGLL
jgi:hypothetical protein